MTDKGIAPDHLSFSINALSSWLFPTRTSGRLLIVTQDSSYNTEELGWDGDITSASSIDSLGCKTQFDGVLLAPNAEFDIATDLTSHIKPNGFCLALGTKVSLPSLKRQRAWRVLLDSQGALRLIDLTTGQDTKASRPMLVTRQRFLPSVLLRRTMSPVGTLSSNGPFFGTRLDAMIDRTRNILDAQDQGLTITPGSVQEKDKFITKITHSEGASHYLKLPLSPLAAKDLYKSASVLDALHVALPDDHIIKKFLPVIKSRISGEHYDGLLEQECKGTPLAYLRTGDRGLSKLLEACEIIMLMHSIPEDDLLNLEADNSIDLRAGLAEHIEQHDPPALPLLAKVLDMLSANAGRLYLRKGDMTLSNILFEDNRISGVIDWDDSGATRWPLADLADLILSWTWRREGMPRAETMGWLLSTSPRPLASGLDIDQLLAITGKRHRDLALGALQSLVDHAYNELKHPRAKMRDDRVKSLLLDPLTVVAPLLDFWIEPESG